MADFFISLSGKDKAWGDWIAWQLKEAGFEIIYHHWDFQTGQNFLLHMEEAGRKAARMLVVLSNHYFASDFTLRELTQAIYRDPAGRKGTVIPVVVGECDLAGSLLGPVAHIDLTSAEREEVARHLLLDGLREKGPPPSAPPFPGARRDAREWKPVFPGAPSDSLPRSNELEPLRQSYRHSDRRTVGIRRVMQHLGDYVDTSTSGSRIFIAHVTEDKAQVRELYAHLKARGLEPWLDEIDLLPGQIWKDEIPRAIREAAVFLACLSSRSVDKVGYVQNEFRLALSAFGERPPGSIYLIPVRLDECDVPDLRIPDRGLSLQDIQWVNLWQEGGLDRLVASIERALTVGTSPRAVRKEAPTTSWPPEPVVLQSKVVPGQPPVLIAPNDLNSFLSQPVDRDSLVDYTKWKYPDLPIDYAIQTCLSMILILRNTRRFVMSTMRLKWRLT